MFKPERRDAFAFLRNYTCKTTAYAFLKAFVQSGEKNKSFFRAYVHCFNMM
ncbi:hypothetical protein RF007C_04660 [Ruminococcus flavefaciens 007c]|uniref:Uncharacterized protein n=1 Tax=Ruminococcus flavefaciens 007c TaxID=1341157 RepID=W7UJM1_RUMFL|nr:hypothetical protein RF007C_04660 [Ruminococcus flavefaciens 007c]